MFHKRWIHTNVQESQTTTDSRKKSIPVNYLQWSHKLQVIARVRVWESLLPLSYRGECKQISKSNTDANLDTYLKFNEYPIDWVHIQILYTYSISNITVVLFACTRLRGFVPTATSHEREVFATTTNNIETMHSSYTLNNNNNNTKTVRRPDRFRSDASCRVITSHIYNLMKQKIAVHRRM